MPMNPITLFWKVCFSFFRHLIGTSMPLLNMFSLPKIFLLPFGMDDSYFIEDIEAIGN